MMQHRRFATALPSKEALSQNNGGGGLVAAIVLLTAITALVVGYLSMAVDATQWTSKKVEQRRLRNAAESAIALAVNDLWGDFEELYPGGEATHWDFRFFLEGKAIASSENLGAATPTSLVNSVSLAQNEAGEFELDNVIVDELTVWRRDEFSRIQLYFEASVHSDAVLNNSQSRQTLQQTVQETYLIEAPEWSGLNYALLANNINCIMCHTEVDNAERFYNTDPDQHGTFERVRLGSLESMQFRQDPHSWVAGTLYLAGQGLNADGSALNDWSSFNYKSREFSNSGQLVQDEWGQMTVADLVPDSSATPQPGANLYLEYDSNIDGYLPSTFPAPFPDDGGYDFDLGATVPENSGNRVVDDSEFWAAVASSKGSLGGGVINTIEHGTQVDSEAKLDALLTSSNTASLDTITEANVSLQGTADNPILLNGDVAIDGDLIIQGVVKGSGSIKVSGNIYVPTDLVYADGTTGGGERTYGVAADGTNNVMAMAAGGNVIVGDIFHPKWGEGDPVDGTPNTDYNFIMEELGLFNRMEWIKTQPTLPGKTEQVKVGENTVTHTKWNWEKVEWEEEVPNYPYEKVEWEEEVPVYGVADPSLPEEYQTTVVIGTEMVTKYKWVQGEQDGTKIVTKYKWETVGDSWTEDVVQDVLEWQTPEYPNPYYEGPDFVARYYHLSEGTPVPIFNKQGHFDPTTSAWISEEQVGSWDEDFLTIADPSDPTDPILSGAVLSPLTTHEGWLSNDLLRKLVVDANGARDVSKPFEIDSLLYSGNSVFGIIPKRNAEGLNGEMLLNGGLVASDIGLLAPERFQLNYDDRAGGALRLISTDQLSIRRHLRAPTIGAHP